jgi:uncharacterized protein YyaL (SSP411 family)
MNLLQSETSPYLLQHANNPVHWMPWSEQAFKKALAENKPVLVSIGYSSCHWCHVMEHESFENEETATLMNNLFVNIKVDREEYPDIDHMYMDAVQAMTGSGGWPLNVFLTPDKKPFYGGTYFPPVRAHGRASWKEVLMNVSQYFTQNRNDVDQQAFKLVEHLKQVSSSNAFKMVETKGSEEFQYPADICQKINEKILANADKEDGGFGNAPKFPSTFSIKFLLDHYTLFNNQDSLQQALLSLDKMMMGGIYDQLGGGFARYSTDKFWIAPHFEKMLYDNALLIEVYAIAFSITKNLKYKTIVDETIAWLLREMTSEEFGFYSAIDADSEGVEGKFYTWGAEELKTILQDDYTWFASYYQIEDNGNWEHTNILFTTYESIENLSAENKTKLQSLHQVLFEHRKKRIRPITDDKILLGWNALMNKALTIAYTYLQNEEYLVLAKKNMNFLMRAFESDHHLMYHTYKNGTAKIPAYADDLAYTIDALICLGTATADVSFLLKANEIMKFVDRYYVEDGNPMYSFTNTQFSQVEINKKEIYDGALPSTNSVLCKVLKQLAYIFQHDEWNQKSNDMLFAMNEYLQKHPLSFARWCSELQKNTSQFKEVCIVGLDAKKIFQQFNTKKYYANVLFITTHKEEDIASLKGKYQVGENLIYVCKDFTCLEPFRDVNSAFVEI